MGCNEIDVPYVLDEFEAEIRPGDGQELLVEKQCSD